MKLLPLGLVTLFFLPHFGVALLRPSKRSHAIYDYYVLEHDPLAGAPLHEVLDSLGLQLVEQTGELRNHWLVYQIKSDYGGSEKVEDSVLKRLEQLRTRATSAEETDLMSRSIGTQQARRLVSSIKHLSQQHLRQRVKRDDSRLRAPPPVTPEQPDSQSNSSSRAIAQRLGILDPEFTDQWHLVNDAFPTHMVNVTLVWEMGITGEGVIASMVDDGLDFESDDLADNFDPEDSYDFNDHVPLPKPVLFDDHHGTRCAGQIAAVKNNVCGVGIAYNAKVAGVRILSGPISDVDEATALNYGYQNTSIYSCSWGPLDDGRSMEGPSYIIKKAVLNGIQNGRGGKGSIFVFASGNGAAQGDQCNFDGYTNSIYSVTVAAVDYKGLHPYYSEACAANMVVTYSSGSGKNIVTTDVGKNKCSHSHGGTSAAAPNAVGIFALALSVRPDLTWRDVQHLCVRSAKMINPDDPDWDTTAAGRRFSYKYGYGSLDAYEYVKAAQDWQLVKPQAWVKLAPVQINNGTMNATGEMSGGAPIVPGGVRSSTTVTKQILDDNNFENLEHVNVQVWISHTIRGDVEVEMISPNGIKSVLAGRRKYDHDNGGFPGWTFMTLKHWDEDPMGEWTLRVSDQHSEDQSGYFLGWSMTLWGSVVDPSMAKDFILTDVEPILPPNPEGDSSTPPSFSDVVPTATTSKTRPKPTAHLPGDHGTAEGEADKPAFPSGQGDKASPTAASPTASPTEPMIPTPDEGWFSDMSKLVYNQKWLFGAVGAVVLFGVLIGVFFFWRLIGARRRRGNYSSVLRDDVPMGSIDRGGHAAAGAVTGTRTKELYDAFGELSDDDDADEETGLRDGSSRLREGLLGSGLGYHLGFLDDDEPRIDLAPEPLYRDEPEQSDPLRHSEAGILNDGAKSPGSTSGDGSWEHASNGP